MSSTTSSVDNTPTSSLLSQAQILSSSDSAKAESLYKQILGRELKDGETASRDYEAALVGLGEMYRDQKKPAELAELLKMGRSTFSSFAKAKSAKLGKHALFYLYCSWSFSLQGLCC